MNWSWCALDNGHLLARLWRDSRTPLDLLIVFGTVAHYAYAASMEDAS
jgi:hypothetical protein